jgi:hypothetical protein
MVGQGPYCGLSDGPESEHDWFLRLNASDGRCPLPSHRFGSYNLPGSSNLQAIDETKTGKKLNNAHAIV